MSSIERVRRGKHPFFGPYVLVRLRGWDNPDPLGEDGPATTGRYVWSDHVVFRHQWIHGTRHPRHLEGFNPVTGELNACVSPSYSGHGEICKYVDVKWRKPA